MDMLHTLIKDIKCLQTCSSYVEKQIIDNRQEGILSIEDSCASRCDICIYNRELCQECHLKGHSSWIPSLRACEHCITHDLNCIKLVVVAFSLDSESKNSSAQEEYKNLKDNDPWLFLLAGSPDAVHTCKRMTRHASNWFLSIEGALINRVQLRALRNDRTINGQLKKIFSVAAFRGRDCMDVDSRYLQSL